MYPLPYHRNVKEGHIVSLISCSVLFFIMLTPIHEFNKAVNPDPTQWMLIAGIASLILLLRWRNIVIKNIKNGNI
ncbi:MAG: hypothetical protein O8C60_00405 [Candidatus Methanoperedens sp.]|nr:hypothetical protein [Candidatus Methanoperedens sp.]